MQNGKTPVPPPKPPKVEVRAATAWADGQVGSEKWRGRCQRFVESAYGAKTGYANANEAAEAIGLRSGSVISVPAGALIYFQPNCPGATGKYGHVGLSLGNGKMVSALGEVTVTDLRTSNRWRKAYSGWTYPPKSWPGR
jgi:cell wall-associated NlpC family hydrolase